MLLPGAGQRQAHHVGGPGLPQQADDARDGRAAHDAVVHEDDPFPAHRRGDGVELYPDCVLAPGLAGLEETAAREVERIRIEMEPPRRGGALFEL